MAIATPATSSRPASPRGKSAAKIPPENRSAARESTAATLAPLSAACDSLTTADRLLFELGKLEAIEARVKADCDRAVADQRRLFESQLFVEVAGARMAIADRCQQIRAELKAAAAKYSANWLEEGKKSRELSHGTFGWQNMPAKIVPAEEGASEAGKASLLDDLAGFLRKAVEKFGLFAIGTARFVRIQVAFDRQAILASAKAGDLTAANLRKLGFALAKPSEKFFVEAKAQEIQQTADAS